MQVNMLEAKSQLSRLVQAAIAGEEVIIASKGQAKVRLVPCEPAQGLKHWGGLRDLPNCDAAFSEETEALVGKVFSDT